MEDVFDTDHPNPRVTSKLAGAAQADAGLQIPVIRLAQVHDPIKQGLVTPLVELAREGAEYACGSRVNR